MKPNELRIGNWVMYDGRYFQIDSVGSELPFLKTIEFGVGVVTYDNIQPIRLTEETLLKCGLKKQGDGFYKIKTKVRGTFLEINIKTKVVVLCTYGDFSDVIHIKYTKYLHTLQNLVHSLSGEELNIQL